MKELHASDKGGSAARRRFLLNLATWLGGTLAFDSIREFYPCFLGSIGPTRKATNGFFDHLE